MTLTGLLGTASPADVLLGLQRDEAAGRDATTLPAAARVVDGAGRLPRGALCLAADVALGIALQRGAANVGARMVTSHLHVDLAADADWVAGQIVCQPEVVSLSERSGLATGRLLADGRYIGQTTARFGVLAAGDRAARALLERPAPAREDRAPSGPVSIDDLARLQLSGAEGPTIEARLVAHPDFANERGGVHGGLSGLLAERLATNAVEMWLGPARGATAVELRVFFVRPFAAAGQSLTARITQRRLGATVAVTATEVRDADGRTVVLADAVHALDPPGPAPA